MARIRVEELIYEVDDKGERVIVKSMACNKRAYLRFTNRTSRPVNIWWRDFNGMKRHYVYLQPGAYYDVNSFITHPWEFTDVSTHENFVINNKRIFRAPPQVGSMLYRTNWNISVSVRTLRQTCLLALAALLPDAESAARLDLPTTLSRELADLIPAIINPPPVIDTER